MSHSMPPRWYDVSMEISSAMPVYKNRAEKRPVFEITSNFPEQPIRETRVHLDVHTGTHVDAPLHMAPDGNPIDTIGLDQLVRPCCVVDVTQVDDAIHRADLAHLDIQQGDFLVFKTRNSQVDAFDPAFVYLAEDAATWLAQRAIAGVGIDGLGVERSQPGHPTHKALFAVGAVIIEGLRLRDIPAGSYWMIALPIRLAGLDAAPARVLLAPVER